MTALKPLTIGNKTARLPIIQGGMGVGISLSGLASAVAKEGGIGVIAAAGIGMFEKDFHSNFVEANIRALRREIRRARQLTDGIIGLNLMVAFSDYNSFAKVAVEEGIDIIFSGAGLPMNLPEVLQKDSFTKLVPIVSSGRAAKLICRRWISRYDYLPDALVVEGPRAGGHLGFTLDQIDDNAFSLENLIADVLVETNKLSKEHGSPIPVIAAGGIYTGADMRTFFDLGADGVQMGTRFVATHECDADQLFKQSYVDARSEDIVIIQSPVGMPGRAIRNDYLDDVRCGTKMPYSCPYHCILTCNYETAPFCIAHALTNAKRGRLRHGFAFAGANVNRVHKIVSVHDLMTALVAEYNEADRDLISAVKATDEQTSTISR